MTNREACANERRVLTAGKGKKSQKQAEDRSSIKRTDFNINLHQAKDALFEGDCSWVGRGVGERCSGKRERKQGPGGRRRWKNGSQ